MEKNAELTLNISATSPQYTTTKIRFSTQDGGSAKLTFFLFKDGVELPLNGVTGKIVMRMADGSKFLDTVILADRQKGIVEYRLTPEQLKHSGQVISELYLNYVDGQKIAVSRFSFRIDQALIDIDIPVLAEYYIDDFSSLQSAINGIADETTATIQDVANNVEEAKEKADETIALIEANDVAKQEDLEAVSELSQTNSKSIEVMSNKVFPELLGVSKNALPAVNTQLLQQALDKQGHIFLSLPGTYFINSTLFIGDNTTFELGEGVEIKLAPGSNCNMLKNKDIINRNKNIQLMGGTWNYDWENQTASGNLLTMLMILQGIDGLTIKNVKTLNARKYCYLVADATDIKVRDLDFDTHSDGFHMQGPIKGADIRNLRGKTEDDLLAFTIGDYSAYEVSRGHFEDIYVNGLYPKGSLCAVKMAGNPNYRYKRIVIENIFGTVTTSAIKITDDTNLAPTDIENVTFRNIHVLAPNNIIFIGARTVRDLLIDNLVCTGTSTEYVKISAGLTNGKNIQFTNLRVTDRPATPVIILNEGVVQNLFVNGANLEVAAGCSVIKQAKTIEAIILANIYQRYGGELVQTTAESTAGTKVLADNVRVREANRVINAKQSTVLKARNLVYENTTGAVMSSDGTVGSVVNRVDGDVEIVGAAILLSLTAGAKASVDGRKNKVNAQILTPLDGDMVMNINEAFNGGAGLMLYDKTAWRKL